MRTISRWRPQRDVENCRQCKETAKKQPNDGNSGSHKQSKSEPKEMGNNKRTAKRKQPTITFQVEHPFIVQIYISRPGETNRPLQNRV